MGTTGQCRCGKVKFAFDGPVMLTAACHCRGCQLMTSSAFSLSTLTPLSRFRLVEGETVIGGLRAETEHRFCDFCKTWLYTPLESLGDLVNVRTATLDHVHDDPPYIECWTQEKLPWAQTGSPHSYATQPDLPDFGSLMEEFASANRG